MTEQGFKKIAIKAKCDYAKVISPEVASFSDGELIYSMGLRLSQAQHAKLVAKGYKGNTKIKKDSDPEIIFYNFNRRTLSRKGNKLPPLKVVRWDKRPFTREIGDGSTVILVLEYCPTKAGIGKEGKPYPAGTHFRMAVVQVLNWIEQEEYIPVEDESLVDNLKEYPMPEGYVEEQDGLEAHDSPPAIDDEDYPEYDEYDGDIREASVKPAPKQRAAPKKRAASKQAVKKVEDAVAEYEDTDIDEVI